MKLLESQYYCARKDSQWWYTVYQVQSTKRTKERKAILKGDLIHWRLTVFSLMTLKKFLTVL